MSLLSQSFRIPVSSFSISSISRCFALRCSLRPSTSSPSWVSRSCSCDFCPSRAPRRCANSNRSLATIWATADSLRRAIMLEGKMMVLAPSRSAKSLAWRTSSWSRLLATMARLVLVAVSSSLARMSPAFTRSPSRTLICPMIPPAGC